ncbi:hypothetical protein GWK47_000573 [Chionoecetes opilio]|uniref:Uncharacterized protein n=1 Tax=Chionoecetes opilio TaxID=41210 RepID=A0A8J5CII9_CHIOP|nr:hypothetical protein GWK47_000573 [Chionoecetes opilio]
MCPVTEEPSGRYLWHFVPEDPVPPEKPAFKVAKALYDLLVTYDSTDSLIVLQGDSTRANTGWKGGYSRPFGEDAGTQALLEYMRVAHNELPLRHLITSIDGPTSFDTGFTGPVCCPAWLTTAQSPRVHEDQKAWTDWQRTEHPGNPVKYCLQVYFKLYYDIKVHHRLEDGPKHILTQLRVMRSQPKKVQTAVTFYLRTGAWFAHSECVLLSLTASQSEDALRFAVTQILKLRAGEEYGDTSVRPRITPKLNLSATSL